MGPEEDQQGQGGGQQCDDNSVIHQYISQTPAQGGRKERNI